MLSLSVKFCFIAIALYLCVNTCFAVRIFTEEHYDTAQCKGNFIKRVFYGANDSMSFEPILERITFKETGNTYKLDSCIQNSATHSYIFKLLCDVPKGLSGKVIPSFYVQNPCSARLGVEAIPKITSSEPCTGINYPRRVVDIATEPNLFAAFSNTQNTVCVVPKENAGASPRPGVSAATRIAYSSSIWFVTGTVLLLPLLSTYAFVL